MSRLFDPVEVQNLLSEQLEENATKNEPLPPGEVIAQIMEQKFSSGISGPKAKHPGTPWHRLDSKLEITDREYLSNYADGTVEKVTRNLGIPLDMTDEGKIAVGPNKNVRLGKLRMACGTNGKPLEKMVGCTIRIMISQKPHPDDSSIILDDITSYTKV